MRQVSTSTLSFWDAEMEYFQAAQIQRDWSGQNLLNRGTIKKTKNVWNLKKVLVKKNNILEQGKNIAKILETPGNLKPMFEKW